MQDPVPPEEVQGGLTEDQKRENVIRLAFGGDRTRFEEFCRAIDEVVPAGKFGRRAGQSLKSPFRS